MTEKTRIEDEGGQLAEGVVDPAEDTEGHRRNFRVDGPEEDTEGHRRNFRVDGPEEDTEGHRKER